MAHEIFNAGYDLAGGPVVAWYGRESGNLPVWVFPSVKDAKAALAEFRRIRRTSFAWFSDVAVLFDGVATNPNDLPPLADMAR